MTVHIPELKAFSSWLPRSRTLWIALLLTGGMFGAVLTVMAQTGGSDVQVQPGGPTVQFAQATYDFKRTDGFGNITVTLSSAASQTVTVQIASSDGTAAVNEDYGVVTQTVMFAAGTTQQTVSVIISNNGETAPEYFTVTLSNPSSNASLGAPSTATINLGVGSPPAATVAFDYPSWSYTESTLIATISVTMTGTPTGQVSVQYDTSDGTAKAGINYTPASGLLTWQPSEVNVSKTFTIPLIDDGNVDPTLTVNLVLSNPVNATLGFQSTATLKILDADGICP